MSIQGDADGGQLKAVFEAYNVNAGSEIVNMAYSYNTGKQYSEQISNGSQIIDAFKAINADLGLKLLQEDVSFNWSDGVQLKYNILKLISLSNLDAPVWAHLENVNITQGDAFPLVDLDDHVLSTGITTFAIGVGELPAGITLDGATGVISGTASSTDAAGTVSFVATDDNGTTESNWVDWSVRT